MKPNGHLTSRPWTCLVLWAAMCACAFAGQAASGPTGPAAAPHLELERVQPLGGNRQRTQQLLLSPDGRRMAWLSSDGVALWQLQPPQSLAKMSSQKMPTLHTSSRTGWRTHESIAFDATGRLHYLSHAAHVWLNPDLTQGASDSDVQAISADGRYALRYNTVGDKPGETPPQYSGARDDIYDLQQQRSTCQLPGTADPGPGAFGGHWFAAQLRALGPSIPRPLVVCDMRSGQVVGMSPSEKRVYMQPFLDPQGRFLRLSTSGEGLFRRNWAEDKMYALPLPAADFVIGQGSAFECKVLPCGAPRPLGLPENDIPWTRDVSPDGQWWVRLASQLAQAEFFRWEEGQVPHKVATLPYRSPVASASPPGSRPAKHRVVFSHSSRWAALQIEQKLYRVDLQAAKLELAEVHLDAKTAFDLQGIADNGADWLLRDADEAPPDGSVSGLWRLTR